MENAVKSERERGDGVWGKKLPSSGVRRKQAAPNPSHERNPDFLGVSVHGPRAWGWCRGQFRAWLHTAVSAATASCWPCVEKRAKEAVEQTPAPASAFCFSMDHLTPSTDPGSHPPLLASAAPHGWLAVLDPPDWCPAEASSCAEPRLWR